MAFVLTVRIVTLLQRASTGDFDAFQEVWPLIMDRPLGQDEDLEKAAKELVDVLEAHNAEREAKRKEEEKAKTKATVEEFAEVFGEAVTIINNIFSQSPKKKAKA